MLEQALGRPTVAALITCHNRKRQTLACIEQLRQQEVYGSIVKIFVLDDGSTDDTGTDIRRLYPDVVVIDGNGQCYWNGGMRVVFAQALAKSFDLYLWLNDDTQLHSDALARLIATHRKISADSDVKAIVVGSTADPSTGCLSYGGWKFVAGFKRLKFQKVMPDAELTLECDSMNGNCVLIPHAIAQSLNNLDPVFTHAMGDIDYGLRARQNGYRIFVAPGFFGRCAQNLGRGLWTDTSLSAQERWKRLLGVKGLPPKEWRVFTQRHAGWLWPLYWLNPYLSFWLRIWVRK